MIAASPATFLLCFVLLATVADPGKDDGVGQCAARSAAANF